MCFTNINSSPIAHGKATKSPIVPENGSHVDEPTEPQKYDNVNHPTAGEQVSYGPVHMLNDLNLGVRFDPIKCGVTHDNLLYVPDIIQGFYKKSRKHANQLIRRLSRKHPIVENLERRHIGRHPRMPLAPVDVMLTILLLLKGQSGAELQKKLSELMNRVTQEEKCNAKSVDPTVENKTLPNSAKDDISHGDGSGTTTNIYNMQDSDIDTVDSRTMEPVRQVTCSVSSSTSRYSSTSNSLYSQGVRGSKKRAGVGQNPRKAKRCREMVTYTDTQIDACLKEHCSDEILAIGYNKQLLIDVFRRNGNRFEMLYMYSMLVQAFKDQQAETRRMELVEETKRAELNLAIETKRMELNVALETKRMELVEETKRTELNVTLEQTKQKEETKRTELNVTLEQTKQREETKRTELNVTLEQTKTKRYELEQKSTQSLAPVTTPPTSKDNKSTNGTGHSIAQRRMFTDAYETLESFKDSKSPYHDGLLQPCTSCHRPCALFSTCFLIRKQSQETNSKWFIYCYDCGSKKCKNLKKSKNEYDVMKGSIFAHKRMVTWILQFGLQWHGECVACAHKVYFDDFHMAHDIAAADGGPNDPDNLFVSCSICNTSTSTTRFSIVAQKTRENKGLPLLPSRHDKSMVEIGIEWSKKAVKIGDCPWNEKIMPESQRKFNTSEGHELSV